LLNLPKRRVSGMTGVRRQFGAEVCPVFGACGLGLGLGVVLPCVADHAHSWWGSLNALPVFFCPPRLSRGHTGQTFVTHGLGFSSFFPPCSWDASAFLGAPSAGRGGGREAVDPPSQQPLHPQYRCLPSLLPLGSAAAPGPPRAHPVPVIHPTPPLNTPCCPFHERGACLHISREGTYPDPPK